MSIRQLGGTRNSQLSRPASRKSLPDLVGKNRYDADIQAPKRNNTSKIRSSAHHPCDRLKSFIALRVKIRGYQGGRLLEPCLDSRKRWDRRRASSHPLDLLRKAGCRGATPAIARKATRKERPSSTPSMGKTHPMVASDATPRRGSLKKMARA